MLDTRRDSRIARLQMNKQPISKETGGLSDSKRLTTNDDDEQTTIAVKDNDDDEVELQGSSSFCVTIRFSTRPMTNNNNN